MNTMTYKGYTARIEFDDRDSILVGRLLGIADVVGFHADNVRELRAAFKDAVTTTLMRARRSANAPKSPPPADSCCGYRPRFTAQHWWPHSPPARA